MIKVRMAPAIHHHRLPLFVICGMAKTSKTLPSENAPRDVNWAKAVQPLIAHYKGRKHPLEYKNTYQLVVMVVLSAQDSDKHINEVAKGMFEAFPDMEALGRATLEEVQEKIRGVRKFKDKAAWLLEIAQT